jgi:phosphoglycolate phosphatase-like HAD superfamily hydrolase
LGVELERCWMIGDSPNDLRAARAVGAGAIAVGYGLVDADRLRSEEPDAFLDRFEQLLGYLSIDAIDAAGD